MEGNMLKQKLTKHSKHHFLLKLLLLITLGLVLVYISDPGHLKKAQTKSSGNIYQVVLTDQGFRPDRIQIDPGSSVRFTTTLGKYFWPASNPHPTHEIYSGFDSKQPIAPNNSWTFRFDQVGEWRYHDHLIPGLTGLIVVENKNGVASTDACQSISQLSQPQQEDCWQASIDQALSKDGVGAAFQVVKKLYKTEPGFIVDGCHLQAHRLGEAAYGLYLKNPSLDRLKIDASSVSCGYGFFHGFLEHLFRANPDIGQGRQFCRYLIERLSSEVPAIRLNCYHALGHGFVNEPPQPSAWGNPQAMVNLALERCEEVSPSHDVHETNECLQGAFNVLGDWIAAKKYGINPPDNSMWLCPEQKSKPRQMACYYELSMRIKNLHAQDIATIYQTYVKDITDLEAQKLIINNSSAGLIERAMAQSSYNNFVEMCLRLPDQLDLKCVGGILGGIMAQAEPGIEYVKALKTCAEANLSERYRDYCYQRLGESLRRFYSLEKVIQICQKIDQVYRKHCYE